MKIQMTDFADKAYLKNDRIQIGYLDMERIKARELLALIMTDDWRYFKPEQTDVSRTFQRNMGLP